MVDDEFVHSLFASFAEGVMDGFDEENTIGLSVPSESASQWPSTLAAYEEGVELGRSLWKRMGGGNR